MTYTYEGISSRVDTVSEAIGTSIYDYDVHGHIKSYEPAVPSGFGQITYEWNSIGQKAAMTVPIGYGSKARRIEYSYDNTGRQTGMDVLPVIATSQTGLDTDSPSSQTRFFYDHSKKRVSLINKAGDVYYFVYDPTASVPAVVYEQGAHYRYLNIREPDGSLISRDKYIDDTRLESRTYHFDGLGSTIALTDEGGNVTDNYSYDAWGSVISHTGNTTDNPYQYVGQLGYYTHYQESDLHMLQLGVRYYDPQIGRFTQRDPIHDGLNWYVYVRNAPTSAFDPYGLWWGDPDVFFSWHYRNGHGRAVDLLTLGFLASYRNTNAVKAEVRRWRDDVKRHLKAKARSACKRNPSLRYVDDFWRDGMSQSVDTLFDAGWFTVAQHTLNEKGACRISVDCCKKRFQFECILSFDMYDRWRDPTGLGISLGTPFDITGSWQEPFIGRESF